MIPKDIHEAKILKDSSINSSVQKVREPIKRSKAQIQTLNITTGYGWDQTAESINIHVKFVDAAKLSTDDCTINTTPRSLEFIIFDYNSAHHQFKINQLYSFIDPAKSSFKLKKDKIVITLTKQKLTSNWLDLKMKTTQKTFEELERSEKANPTREKNTNYDTPFAESSCRSHPPPPHEEHK